jgi:putative ABC transport system ATP-binding protein
MPIIQAENIRKVYGKIPNQYEALKGVSLSVEKGESVAIVGKSGSGKSTLMHVLAGLDTVTEGSVTITDIDLKQVGENRRADLRNQTVGFIFQQFFLQPSLSVLENVILPLKIAGMAPAKRTSEGMQALREVGLESKAKNRATDLSGGERQRVAIARALAGNPQILFADEPTGNLDTETSDTITDLLFRLQKDRGITLIIVTHDLDLAERCGRIVTIKDGLIIKKI